MKVISILLVATTALASTCNISAFRCQNRNPVYAGNNTSFTASICKQLDGHLCGCDRYDGDFCHQCNTEDFKHLCVKPGQGWFWTQC
ncbi:hypothetical protein P168DRAFT_292966 [Aspergillus campestris IBT 28561]|uniref:Uncharacterized protein n=1 Tax=Aspergillus campestris (strain IBT 28561) TaxID=1392248 RepID=A0A2I1CTZ0_ASPC2|nr:uncharacterized protein P168DRAFT_292966 [Aspergillus campestris IBT 28561]PKY01077.1 hypothetical protein P168DRAFT_292966 [Aspergillus campestris IBT 28561]